MTTSKEARIEVATSCNYSCVFCPMNTDDFTRGHEMMGMKLFTTILTKLPKQTEVITISGMGEMFLNSRVYDMIELCKSKGYRVNALTNGSLFSHEIDMKRLIDSGLDSLRVSFHSLDYNDYEKITGAKYMQFYNAYLLLENLKNYAPSMEVILSATLEEPNDRIVRELVNEFEGKVDLLEVWVAHNWGDWKDYRSTDEPKLQTCGRPFNGPLQIQVDGTMNMCCFDFNGELEIGDLKEMTAEEIYLGVRYKQIKNYHNGDHDVPMLCDDCDQRNVKNPDILLYNSKWDKSERVGKTSTVYEGMK